MRMRVGKVLAWIFGALVGLVVVAAVGLWLGGDRAAIWAIEHPVSGALGRRISVGGPLHIDWGTPTRIVMEDVHLANAGWSDQPDMFAAERVEIDVFPRSLLFGPRHIPLIALDNAKLLLETSAKGERNWDFGVKAAVPQKRTQFPDIEKFTVVNGGLAYRDGTTQAETDVSLSKLDMAAPDPASEVKINGAGIFQKQKMRFDGVVGPLAQLRDATKPYPIKFKGAMDRADITADGTIKEPLDMNGVDMRVSLSGTKLEELAATFGVPLPQLPDFRTTMVLNGGNGDWQLNALTIALGKSDLEGGLEIDTNAKVPHIQANLTSKFLDLTDFSGFVGAKPATSSAAAAPPDPSGRILPYIPLPLQKLPDLNADVSFYGTKIQSEGGLPIDQVTLALQLKDSSLKLKPLRFHTAKGDVDITLDFNPFTKTGPPHLKADVDIRHIDLHELLAGPDMSPMVKQTAGTVGGFLKVDTNGVTVRQVLGRANGDFGLFMENGQLSQLLEQLAPIDVLGALGVYVRGDKPVQINCLIARFDVKDGVATPSTFLFDTNEAQVAGSGKLSFADETLDLVLKPTNKSFTSLSLRAPVDIDGTFGKPTFHLETGSLIARVGAAIGLGIVFPPAALLPLVDTGLGDNNACSKAYADQKPPGQGTPETAQAPQKKAKGAAKKLAPSQ
jgi:uncharacterized protein involved in outer membrane biogenesis